MSRTACMSIGVLLLALPAGAQSLAPDEVLSSVVVRAISAPNPVRGTDGRVHLAYELLVDNVSHVFVTLDRVEALDPSGRVVGSLEGEALAAMTEAFGASAPLPPGGTAVVLMDVSVAGDAPLPSMLAARLAVTRAAVGTDGKPSSLPADFPVPASVSFTGASVPVGAPAVVVAPPLAGRG